jgi:TonB family protein
MLVHPKTQEQNLLQRVDPVFPPNTSGTVRIGIIVARDGRVRKATFVEGDPSLADAAITAVRQWSYRPTVSNWEPVEVRSEVLLTSGRTP